MDRMRPPFRPCFHSLTTGTPRPVPVYSALPVKRMSSLVPCAPNSIHQTSRPIDRLPNRGTMQAMANPDVPLPEEAHSQIAALLYTV